MTWAPPEGRRFAAPDGATLAYDDPTPEAPGTPVLALAGLTRNAGDFDFLRPHLPQARLIAMDYRGRGRSDFSGPETYTIRQEAADALSLLDHLGLARAAILGTSRGGLIAMTLAAMAPERLAGAVLNDIGPEIAPVGLEIIKGYLGRPPTAASLDEQARLAAAYAAPMGFADVPLDRWRAAAARQLAEGPDGLSIRYDPALRDAVLASGAQPAADPWPLFDALPAPLAALRGAGSNLLAPETFAAMRARRPDMLAAEVPGRGHVPFLDEPASLALIRAWIAAL